MLDALCPIILLLRKPDFDLFSLSIRLRMPHAADFLFACGVSPFGVGDDKGSQSLEDVCLTRSPWLRPLFFALYKPLSAATSSFFPIYSGCRQNQVLKNLL